MNEQLTISSNAPIAPSEDYNFLRSEGISLIEKLSGKVWTDYNTHDPGITLLEALCYALTDLGYRTSFDISDILASGNAQNNIGFYTAGEILRSAPVTAMDYRKLIIDTEGVKNAWVEISNDYEVLIYLNAKIAAQNETAYELAYDPEVNGVPLQLKGLYKVLVEYEDHIVKQQNEKKVNDNIRQKLRAHRNLCEDFIAVTSVEYELFTMEAEVQVSEGANIEKINAEIWHVVQSLFSPSVRFYRLAQMRELGYSTEEIFEGPALKHGFIDERALAQSGRFPEIHISDVVNSIMGIDGVIAVRKCVFPGGSQIPFSDFTERMKNETGMQNKVLRLDTDQSVIEFSRKGDRHREASEKKPDKKRVQAIYSFLQSEKGTGKLKEPELDIPAPTGQSMDIDEYYPFQFSLPASYGMKEQVADLLQQEKETLEVDAAGLDMRKRQMLQFKGFLMVFEQVMSNHLSQLAHTRELFSFEPLTQSLFLQPITTIADARLLMMDYDSYSRQSGIDENETGFFRRRNAMLDHLLARFGEDMSKYSFYVRNSQGGDDGMALLQKKSSFLKDYIQISNYRGTSLNLNQHIGVWDTPNVPAAKKRIFRSLGIDDYSTTNITCNWIDIELREMSNQLKRYYAVVREPGNKENVLLESNGYETESEARHVLTYMLQHGINKKLYDNRSAKLALTRKNPQGVTDVIATKPDAGAQTSDESLEVLVTALEKFGRRENLHMVEHILLRPRLYPLAHAKKDTMTSDTLELLSVPQTLPASADTYPGVKRFPYKFNILRKQSGDKFTWKVSLVKSGKTDALIVDGDFVLRQDAAERMLSIREIGADRANYAGVRNADGYYGFSINSKDQTLAAGKFFKEEADREAEIDNLVAYFSFELDLLKDEEDKDEPGIADYADPYSCQVSFFIPNWPMRFNDAAFRYLLEKAIQQEMPAHIYSNVYWLDYGQMKVFENAYKPWLIEMAKGDIPETGTVNQLVKFMNSLRQES